MAFSNIYSEACDRSESMKKIMLRNSENKKKHRKHRLTPSTLLDNSADDKLMIFFLFFPEKRI